MGDIKLFRIDGKTATELEGSSVAVERSLQELIEENFESLLGIHFLASEHPTGKTHRGRIDTLGIDEDGSPAIIEYKRATNQNVINQGLFYLDWLLDHKSEFEMLVLKSRGREAADRVDWSSPRLLCIAGGFSKYDEHAVQQINRNIELFRYSRFGQDLLMLELVNAVSAEPVTRKEGAKRQRRASESTDHRPLNSADAMAMADTQLRDVFEALKEMLLSMGDDVQMRFLQQYVGFKRIKNFVSVVIKPRLKCLYVYPKVDPNRITFEKGFSAPGDRRPRITLRTLADVQKVRPLLETAYEAG